MSDKDKDKGAGAAPADPAVRQVIGVRFRDGVKLGGDEMGSWLQSRHPKFTARVDPAGMSIRPVSDPLGVIVVVPWSNVLSYELAVPS